VRRRGARIFAHPGRLSPSGRARAHPPRAQSAARDVQHTGPGPLRGPVELPTSGLDRACPAPARVAHAPARPGSPSILGGAPRARRSCSATAGRDAPGLHHRRSACPRSATDQRVTGLHEIRGTSPALLFSRAHRSARGSSCGAAGRAWPHNGTRTSCWPIGCAQSIVSNAHAQARNALKGSGVHCVRRAEPRPVAQWCDPFSAHASNAQKGSGAHCVQRPELRSATQWCDSFSACTPGLLGCAS
jgi:hypothetical protein